MYVCCKYIVCVLCNNTENVTPPLNDVLYKGLNALIHISLEKKETFLDSCLVELKNSVTSSVMTVKEGLKGKGKMNRTASQPERNFCKFLDYVDINFLLDDEF